MKLTVSDLIDQTENFDILSQKEQVKLISFFHCSVNEKEFFTTSEIKKEFDLNKIKLPPNVSSELSKLQKQKPPILVKTSNGLAFHRTVQRELEEIFLGNKHKRNVSQTLRNLISKVNGTEQKEFLEEAISCFEIKAYRASIIMTWLLAVDTIYEHILTKKITEFNAALISHGKYKKVTITSKDNFSDIKESDFIEIMRTGKIVSNDIRKILIEKLDFRNTCAHPNTIEVKESKAISFIDDLIENVVKKYQK